MDSQTVFCFGVIVGAAVMYFAARWQMSVQKRRDRSKYKLASTQINIGNRIQNALREAVEINKDVCLVVTSRFYDNGVGYRVYVCFSLSNADFLYVDVNFSQQYPIRVAFPEFHQERYYGATGDQIKMCIEYLQYYIANYRGRGIK